MVRLLPLSIDITRLVQSRVPGEARRVRCAQPLLLRVLRRLVAAGHAGDGEDHRPRRVLRRIPMLFVASRRVRAVRPSEAPDSDPRRVCPALENVDVWLGTTCRSHDLRGPHGAGQGATAAKSIRL